MVCIRGERIVRTQGPRDACALELIGECLRAQAKQ